MKKIGRRVLAYFIDMLVVLFIVQCLSSVPVLNFQYDAYIENYNRYMDVVLDYTKLKTTLSEYYEDGKISDKEYQSLVEDYPLYEKEFISVYQDKKVSKKEFERLEEKINKIYLDSYKEVYYDTEMYSSFYMIVYLLISFLYFVIFNFITKGQTLGKKMMRLKIVSSVDDRVSVWSYVIRFFILYQPIYYIVRLICIRIMNNSHYYQVTSVVYNFQYFLGLLVLIFAVVRSDGRGLHDMLAKTRVILMNKNGEEVEEVSSSIIKKRESD